MTLQQYEKLRKGRLVKLEADYRAGRVRPQPARITTALDWRGLYGPDVDVQCLAQEPAVDEWEAGRAAPSWEQLVALAELTDWPIEFFTSPVASAPIGAIVCQRSGPGKGCHRIETREVIPPYDPTPTPLAAVIPLFGQQALRGVTR